MDDRRKKQAGTIKRRTFVKGAALAGAVAAAGPLAPRWVWGAEKTQKELEMEKAAMEIGEAYKNDPVAMRALEAAKAITSKSKGVELTIFMPAGTVINFMPFTKIWEQETGSKLKFFEVVNVEVDQKLMQEAVTKSGKFDVLPTPPLSLVDLVDAKLLMDIGPMAEKLNPELDGPNGIIKPMDRLTMYYKGKLWGINTDMDIFSMYVRDDLLVDPQNKEAFEKKYGYPLDTPQTYKQLFDQIKFFDKPDQDFAGGFVYRKRKLCWMGWLQQFASTGTWMFDEGMKPNIAGDNGVQVLEEQIAIQDYCNYKTKSYNWNDIYKNFAAGKGYTAFGWPSLGKYANAPATSKVIGKVRSSVVCGTEVNGTVVRAAQASLGRCLSVSNYSMNPELAYCYIQFATAPIVSAYAVSKPTGLFDCYRQSHITNPVVEAAYPKGFPPVLLENMKVAVPGFFLRGGKEYKDALDAQLNAAYAGAIKPKEALEKVSEEWEKITERQGREGQIARWKELREFYPDNFKKVAG
jgi:multiple sugar transport system substrate-binding protein